MPGTWDCRHRRTVAVATCLALASCGQPSLKKVVGDWYVEEVPAGKPSPRLYWMKDGKRIVVDRQIRSIVHPGCIVYETVRPSAVSVVFAVETGKTPVLVATSDGFRPWHLSVSGLRRFELPSTDENGVTRLAMDVVAGHVMCSLAYNQPAFREDWAAGTSLTAADVKMEHVVLDVNGADSMGNTTLSEEVRQRRVDTVDELIRAGADVNDPNAAGITPLMTAIAFDAESTTVMTRLLDAGAEVDAQDKRGMTALMHAARYGRKEAVNLLLARGADPTIRDNDGRTAAAMTGNNADELNRLLEAAAARRK